MRPIVIGVAGGAGSGKTTLVGQVIRGLGEDRITLIQHDAYYRDRSAIPPEERSNINYDHPDVLETSLLVQHLRALVEGETIRIPTYNFTTHARRNHTRPATPKRVVLVEGILILTDPDLRRLMDIKIFVDRDADTRLIRRMRRDMSERGRTLESVIGQYESTVKPMHLEFVEPSKRFADIIIPEGGFNRVAVDMLAAKIQSSSAKPEIISGTGLGQHCLR